MTSHWLQWRRPLSLIQTMFMKKWDIAKFVRAGHQEFWRDITKSDVSKLPLHIFNDLEKKEASPCNPRGRSRNAGAPFHPSNKASCNDAETPNISEKLNFLSVSAGWKCYGICTVGCRSQATGHINRRVRQLQLIATTTRGYSREPTRSSLARCNLHRKATLSAHNCCILITGNCGTIHPRVVTLFGPLYKRLTDHRFHNKEKSGKGYSWVVVNASDLFLPLQKFEPRGKLGQMNSVFGGRDYAETKWHFGRTNALHWPSQGRLLMYPYSKPNMYADDGIPQMF